MQLSAFLKQLALHCTAVQNILLHTVSHSVSFCLLTGSNRKLEKTPLGSDVMEGRTVPICQNQCVRAGCTDAQLSHLLLLFCVPLSFRRCLVKAANRRESQGSIRRTEPVRVHSVLRKTGSSPMTNLRSFSLTTCHTADVCSVKLVFHCDHKTFRLECVKSLSSPLVFYI